MVTGRGRCPEGECDEDKGFAGRTDDVPAACSRYRPTCAACGSLIEEVSQGVCSLSGSDEALRYLVTFLAAGLRAPASTGGEPLA